VRTFVVAVVCAALVVTATGAVIAAFVAMGDSGTSVFELDPGECFDLPEFDASGSRPTTEWTLVDRVDCAEPHTVEVLVTGQLDPNQERPFPGDAEVLDEAAATCRAAAVRADALGFGVLPVSPNEAVWEPRGGPYLCVAIPYGGVPRAGSIVDRVVATDAGR
jgi:hypothetical protein